mgnify:CR=1 FL=1
MMAHGTGRACVHAMLGAMAIGRLPERRSGRTRAGRALNERDHQKKGGEHMHGEHATRFSGEAPAGAPVTSP